MMDNKVLLAKCLTLLYRESQLKNKTENSADLVRTVLEGIQAPDIGIGQSTEKDIILSLKSTILEMCSNPLNHEYDKSELLQRIKINTGYEEKLFDGIKQGIDNDMIDASLKRIILNIRNTLTNYFREMKIAEILNKSSYTLKFNRDSIKDMNQFINETLAQLEPLQMTTTIRDPAVTDDIDIGNDESLSNMFNEIKEINNGHKFYKTGWQGLNRMLGGGFRQGEFIVTGALQHKYKTGFTLSLFSQIAMYNKPLTEDKTKKPLLLRISFEDDVKLNLQFLFQYLKYCETREDVDVTKYDKEVMSDYVRTKLQVNGFHVKLLRVDPTQWTYKSICNKIIELESEGYAVEILMLDYLGMIEPIGCNRSGPGGTDIRDMFRRIRNFTAT